jgi:hypothetical protein
MPSLRWIPSARISTACIAMALAGMLVAVQLNHLTVIFRHVASSDFSSRLEALRPRNRAGNFSSKPSILNPNPNKWI